MRPDPYLRRALSAVIVATFVLGCATAPPPTASPTDRASPVAPSPTASGAATNTPPSAPPSGPLPTGPLPTDAPPTAFPTPAPAVPVTIDAALGARLQALLDTERASWPLPGVSVAVRLASGELWTGASGATATRGGAPVTPDTVFAIASVTKTFIAALILQLAEEGVLSLDDTLDEYIPDFERARRITIRQLLTHTSGIHDYFISGRYREQVFADRKRHWMFGEILDLVLGPYCAPGRCYHYSNTNFVLLGEVAERATGNGVASELRRRFFDPLGLRQTFFQPDEPIPEDRAHGHLISPNGSFTDHSGNSSVIPHLSAVTVAWTAGAIASTPTDLAMWASALYGGHVLQPDSLAQMTDFTAVPEYGMGTRYLSYHGRSAVGHLGGIRGFVSTMAYFPADGLTIVVTLNRGMINPERLVKRVLATLTAP